MANLPMEIKYVIAGIIVMLALILLDLVTRVAVALKIGSVDARSDKAFDWSKLLLFLKTNIVGYFLIWLVVALLPYGMHWLSVMFGFDISLAGIISLEAISGAVWAIIITKLTQSIIGNFKDLSIELKNISG